MTSRPSAPLPATGRGPAWDAAALRAGALVTLVVSVPFMVGTNWARDAESWGFTALFSLGALGGYLVGAACAAWAQRLGLPIAHGVVCAIATYFAVQLVVTSYRIAVGNPVMWFNVAFFATLAGAAGVIGGLFGARLRSMGFVPSSQRSLDHLTGGTTDPGPKESP